MTETRSERGYVLTARSNNRSIKRQRTGSESGPMSTRQPPSDDESESENLLTSTGKSKKQRAEAVQTARQAELREKEKERERARNEAAGRRQERAGRRRIDDSELADETPKSNNSPPPSSQPASPQHQSAQPEKVSHKKGAGKKVKKLGNNQYTKLREQGLMPSSPHSKKRQLATKDSHGAASSGDEQVGAAATNGRETHTSNSTSKNSPDHPNGNGAEGKVKGGPGKFGKGKKGAVNGVSGLRNGDVVNGERTLASMGRSMEAMARSVTAAQVEMAGAWTPQRGGPVQPPGEPDGGLEKGREANGGTRKLSEGMPLLEVPKGSTAMEMADVVSRNIIEWQRRFGHLV